MDALRPKSSPGEALRKLQDLELQLRSKLPPQVFLYKEVDLWDATFMHLFNSASRQQSGSLYTKTFWDKLTGKFLEWIDRLKDFCYLLTAPGLTIPLEAVGFWPMEFSHLDQQVPIQRHLKKIGVECFLIATTQRIHRRLLSKNIASIYAPKVFRNIFSQSRTTSRQLKTHFENIWRSSGMGSDAWTQSVFTSFLNNLYFSIRAVDLTEVLARDFRMRGLCVGFDLSVHGRSAVLKSKVECIPTFWCMNALMSGGVLNKFHNADWIFAPGSAAKDNLISAGLDSQKIAATGWPSLDEDGTAAVSRVGTAHGKIVLVAFSGAGGAVSLEHHKKLIESVSQAAEKLPALTFIAKLHQKDLGSLYAQKHNFKVVEFNDRRYQRHINEWLRDSQVLITGSSTVAVEAMLMGVPVITLDLMSELGEVDFIRAGATAHVTDSAQLVNAIELAIDRQSFRARARAAEFIYQNFGSRDGGASRRCAELITSQISKHEN